MATGNGFRRLAAMPAILLGTLGITATAAGFSGCIVETDTGDGDGGGGPVGPTSGRPSRGSSIAVNEAGNTIAVANKATDDVTLFDRATLTERARVQVGDEPVSLVFAADNRTLYVVNRHDQTVSVITGADGAGAAVASTIAGVGSEPSHAALSPNGGTLYVSSWVDGTLALVDTASGAVSRLDLGGNPHAVCVTNDLDADDADETIYVTDFYSRPRAGIKEAVDGSRDGRVFAVSAGSQAVASIALAPIEIKNTDVLADGTSAFANQLYSCALNGNHLYVTAVGASPQSSAMGDTNFHQNLHGLVYAVDLASGAVDGNRTASLSELVTREEGTRRFVPVPADIAFVAGTDFGYIASLASNSVLRVDFGRVPPLAGVPGINFLETHFSPTGIAIVDSEAYVYNEVGRSISHIDLSNQQTLAAEVPSAPQPGSPLEQEILTGQRFFNTGLARWSTASWVGCVGCHPMGTTDNVTWSFPAGPRQTVDTAATFDASGDIQRILNWTAIFDEVHDFELNTRTVAGGVGAIVSDPALDNASRIDFVGPGGIPDPLNGFNVGSVKGVNDAEGVLPDWDEINEYVRSIRAPRGKTVTSGDPVAGRAIFQDAGCANCHGGKLWTLSELYFTPRLDGDLRDVTFAAEGVTSIGNVRADQTVLDDLDFDTPIIGNDANGAPQRHLCVVRSVGTFDADGPEGRGADEVRQNGPAAQGVDGFNVPSLLNVGTGAPYLHNGAAESLEQLLDPQGQFTAHLQAGDFVFAPSAQQVADLIAFLQTIDDTTEIFPLDPSFQICPVGVVPP
jgi:YVTN family beta-propeller protein